SRFNAFGREAIVIDAGVFESRFYELVAVSLIVNRKIAVDAQALGMDAQEPSTHAVKRADPHPAIGYEGFDALPHFTGGFVGKRDGENMVWLDAVLQKIRDSPGDDARLAAARAGQNEQGSFPM